MIDFMKYSLHHLMCGIACAHASIRTTSLIRVINYTRHFSEFDLAGHDLVILTTKFFVIMSIFTTKIKINEIINRPAYQFKQYDLNTLNTDLRCLRSFFYKLFHTVQK